MNSNLESYAKEINVILAKTLEKSVKNDSMLKASMVYSVLNEGKRIRPLLFILVLKAYGIDYKKYTNVICAIEMIHTYSLVHDDLPALDNDSLRRGKPTVHVRFDEATAILCGDALLTDAFFQLSLTNDDPEIVTQLIKILSYSIGSNGMIYGQAKDLELVERNEYTDFKDIEQSYFYKTGAFFQACLAMAAIIARKDPNKFLKLGTYLGQAFQIQDDILEKTQDTLTIGKSVDSDEKNKKITAVTQLGLENATLLVEKYYSKIDEIINELEIQNSEFHLLILEVANRQK